MSAAPRTCAAQRSGVKTLVSTPRQCWWRWNKSCELRQVAAAICAAKPVSNQSLGLLRGFWVLSSSLCVGCKKLPWNGTWSVWLTIWSGFISSPTLPNKSQKRRKLPNQCPQRLVSCWANSSLTIAWPFHEFLRAAELKEPVQRATRFSD